jgi:hypothetical protein
MSSSCLFCKRHFLANNRKRRPPERVRVGNGRRNIQFNLRAGFLLTPDFQLAADEFGALAHARQAPVSGAPLFVKHLRVDTLSIVTDAQP